jgi:hypothetical protein
VSTLAENNRSDLLLDAIIEEVTHELNPHDDDCWYCGGEGETYDCIDGCCEDQDSGCEECARPCFECKMFEARVAKAIREQVLKSADTDLAISWLKHVGRWSDDITRERVAAEMEAARLAMEESDRPSPAPKDGGADGRD